MQYAANLTESESHMESRINSQAISLLDSIRTLQSPLDEAIERIAKISQSYDSKNADVRYWSNLAMNDCLGKVRLFLNQNFSYIETMSLLAVTRYLHEMSIWLKVFDLDPRYSLVYAYQLFDQQIDHRKKSLERMKLEIDFLEDTGSEEQVLFAEELEKLKAITNENEQLHDAFNLSSKVMELIDDMASRKFSIYAEQAKTNGYSFQAHLIKTKVVVEIRESIAELETEKDTFESSLSADCKELIGKRWVWKTMAEKAGMQDEYDYIYSYTSMLLHAKPFSITTNQKNLEFGEVNIFLKYIHVKIRDILSLASDYPLPKASH
jgi:hypothetical protein